MVVYVFPKFHQNLRSSAIFRVDLAWNYPYTTRDETRNLTPYHIQSIKQSL